jgi:hypothetical protein
MTYNRFGKSQSIGDKFEGKTFNLLEGLGATVQWATTHENRKLHFDIKATLNGRSFKVEVKCPKKNSPKDHLLVETKTVSGGPGWIHGEADRVAQWLDDHSLIVYSRAEIEAILPTPPAVVPREPFSRTSTYKQEYVGRSGTSRYGTVNLDEFIYLPIDLFTNLKSTKVYDLKEHL